MIVEERIYTLQVGKVFEFYKYYEQNGLKIQQTILGNLIGYFHTEIGDLNQVVHMWGYENLGERERRRLALMQDEGWQRYLRESPPYILNQTCRILVPAPFSPIR